MTIIEITPLDNGAHRNQSVSGRITPPEGWAVIPEGMELPNFPFGGLGVDDSVPPVVTSWTEGERPEPEPQPTVPTTEERLDSLEAALAQTDETAIELYEANEEQQTINAAQDEALIEIYEMLEV